jgi:hypothetical protein
MAWWSREGRDRGSARQQGPEDVAALAARNADGVSYFAVGRVTEAIPRFEAAYDGCIATFGADHPHTLAVAGNLAAACVAAGQRRGLDLMAANLADRVRVFGDDDPRTLTAADALASAYRLAGEANEAVMLSTQVTAERRRVLGPTHPDTLVSRMGMALARAAAGDVMSALTLLEVTLHDSEQAHGARHPHTIALRANAAGCLAALGRGDEAVALFRQAVDDSAALLGANHPDTVGLHEELLSVVQDGAPRNAASSSDSISPNRVEVISST